VRDRRPAAAAAVVALALGLTGVAGCSDTADDSRQPVADPPAASPTDHPTDPTGQAGPTDSTGQAGPTDSTAPVKATQDLLDWQPLDASPDDTVMSNGTQLLTIPRGGATYEVSGGGTSVNARAPRGFDFVTGLLGPDRAVVVAEHAQEEQDPVAYVIELDGGRTWRIGPGAEAPPAPGSWAMHGDTLAYATFRGRDYCQVHLDLAARAAEVGYCVDPRKGGFRAPVLGEHGETLLTFDARRPVSCRTPVTVDGATTTPVPGVPRCKGAQAAALEDGTVFSVVPNERRYEEVQMRAATPDGVSALGPGVNGSLTTCGEAAYWTVDAATDRGRAHVMRWDGDTLATVYRSKPGQAFVGTLGCAGHTLTVTALSAAGDELVAANVAA